MKVLRAACLVRDFEFDSVLELIAYLNRLDKREVQWVDLERHVRPDGSVLVRLLTQYNNADLLLL